jgi:photosystem II stability/assembly factor-like uncharacterized protein
MKHTVVFELSGAPAQAVAVEWTDADAPGAEDWEPCLRLAAGRWLLSSHPVEGAFRGSHWREAGRFANIAMRYRLTPHGAWSPISADRKEVMIVALAAETDVPPAVTAKDWPGLASHELEAGAKTGLISLSGLAAAAVQVAWTTAETPGEADWRPCFALGRGVWHLGAAHGLAPGTARLALRYRLVQDGPWSPVSQERRTLALSDGPEPPLLVLPLLLSVPVLMGSGRIGEALRADPGLWTGAVTLTAQWRRNGTDIPGATGLAYSPVAADDLAALTCCISAGNLAGVATAETAALRVTYPAPTVVGTLPEEVFDQGTGDQAVEAAPVFSGDNLAFSVTGARARIDAKTGLVLMPTDAVLDGGMVTVTAGNSGGSAETTFLVTVEGEEYLPDPVEADYIRAPWHTAEKRAAGFPPSDNLQVILTYSRSPVDSDIIYAGQDVGAFWMSRDSGRSWNTLRNRGLGTVHAISVACCPVDVKHVLAVIGSRVKSDRCGIYRSLDGGLSWTRVQPWDKLGEPRTAMSRLACAPSTAGKSRDNVRWYAVFDSASGFSSSTLTGTPGLLTSIDGGATWTSVRNLPADTFGEEIYGCKVDPTSETVLYAWGDRGLFRFGNAPAAAGAYELLSGAGGLPSKPVRDLYISRDGQTLICAAQGVGVYKSPDAGKSWSEILGWSGVTHCAVNEGYPDRIYAYKRGTSPREQVRYTADGGKTWKTNATVVPFPGDRGTVTIGGTEPYILPDPSNEKRAVGFSDAEWAQTDDGGASWNLAANAYYCGAHHKGWASPHSFHASDPKTYFLGLLDAHLIYTSDGGVTLTRRQFDRKALGLVHSSVNGVALNADGRTVIACVGRENKGSLCFSDDLGATWSVPEPATKRRMWLGFDAGNPSYAYQYRAVSSDKGKSWSDLPMPDKRAVIVGVSRTATGGSSAVYAADIEGDGTKIWKSVNRGNSWALVINAGYNISSDQDVRTTFRVHPTDPHVIFYRGPIAANGASQIVRLDTSSGKSTVFDVFNGKTPEGNFYADNFAIDANKPDVMYLRSSSTGTGNYLFMTADGGKSWENVSAGFPNCTGGNGLEVHPLTGVVYIGTANGMYVRKPPYPVPTQDNTYDLLRKAYPRWRDSHLETTF